MSIKQIDRNVINEKGLGKRIDDGAQKLVYDILQATQYSYPIQSTVRELTTNALDSQREKEVAIEILSGKKKVEDYYITRNGDQYAASNFDPTYYDLSRLSTESLVTLKHRYMSGSGFCDVFEVIDRGIGISLKRLEGMISLGFSTKRNTSEGFGAYGLGAKSAFSTGVPSYSIETVYNGKLFKCTCYPYSTSFTVPRFNEDGSENPTEKLSDGTDVHYRRTTARNGTKVTFLTKRNNRGQFKDAVMEQFMYVSGIRFIVTDEYGREETFDPKMPVLHTSQNLIVSDENTYHVPHIVVVKSVTDDVGICYGTVDFKELEMEQLYGSVGFKCPIKQSYRDDSGKEIVLQDGISVTPSREKVIWNDDTKAYILKVIREAEKEAENYLNAQITVKSDSITEWFQKCYEISDRTLQNNGSLLSRLSGIIDRQKLDLTHPTYPQLKFSLNKSMEFVCGLLQFEEVYVDYKGAVIISDVKSTRISWDKLYLKDGNYSKITNMYLCKGNPNLGKFVTWKRLPEDAENVALKAFRDTEKRDTIKDLTDLVESLLLSDPSFRRYSEVIVPKQYEEEIQSLNLKDDMYSMSPADKRRMEQREVAFTPIKSGDWRSPGFLFKKIEPKKTELLNPDHETYWFLQSERVEVEKLLFLILCDLSSYKDVSDKVFCVEWSVESLIWKGSIKLSDFPMNFIQIREELSREDHNENFMHWTDLLYRRDGNVATVHPIVRRAYTRLRVNWKPFASDMSFLRLFNLYDRDAYESYKELYRYFGNSSYYLSEADNLNVKVLEPLKKLDMFHSLVSEGMSDDEKKLLSLRTFGFTDIVDAVTLDQEMIDRMQDMSDFFAPVKDFLNNCRELHNVDVAREALKYMSLYGVDKWVPDTIQSPDETVTKTI